ncbi:hypothetical protein [Streptomyces griseofuscus]|uniref:hypothetical protein n=1 Tax=Streptomyces griseofuscus TaxID=146922 RepID=UPI00345186AE
MNVKRTTGRWSAATVLPIALLAATVATNGATASAAPAPSEASYTVIRDGMVIARTSDHCLRDNTIIPGSQPSYQISGDAKGLGHTWGLNVTVPTGDTPTALAQTAQKVEAKAKKYTKTVVTWRSFIRQPWVTVPTYISKPSGCKYGGSSYKYKGDGRSYSSAVPGTSFRAGVRGVVYWTKSAGPVSACTTTPASLATVTSTYPAAPAPLRTTRCTSSVTPAAASTPPRPSTSTR